MKSKASSFLILLLGSVLWLAVQGANAICPSNLCGGGADNYHPHPSDCAKFCQCVHGNPIERPCAPGTVFSDKVNVCVHKDSELDECTNSNVVIVESPEDVERECQKGTVSLIPHPTACQRYYDCSDTSTRGMYNLFGKYENECDYPELFDINEKKCVNYKVAICGKGRIAATWKCDYLANKCTRSHCIPCQVRNPSCVGKEDGMWPHTSKLWSPYFTTCDSERSVNGEETCPRDDKLGATQLFHPDKRQCLPLWEIPRKHGGYKPRCEDKPPGVYEIEGMQIIAYQCPGEKKFLCRPPYHITQDLSGCIPLSEESNDD